MDELRRGPADTSGYCLATSQDLSEQQNGARCRTLYTTDGPKCQTHTAQSLHETHTRAGTEVTPTCWGSAGPPSAR